MTHQPEIDLLVLLEDWQKFFLPCNMYTSLFNYPSFRVRELDPNEFNFFGLSTDAAYFKSRFPTGRNV